MIRRHFRPRIILGSVTTSAGSSSVTVFLRLNNHVLATRSELETTRLVLRRLEFDDASFVMALLNEPSFIQNIGDRGVRSLEDAKRYLREGPMAMYDSYGFGLWHTALKSDATPVGMCGLLQREYFKDPDVGFAFFPEFWGRGFAFEAAEATLRHGLVKYGMKRVIATVAVGNTGSIRVLEKLGMEFERMYDNKPGEPQVRLYGRTLKAG
jgi:RimJ/RimL family protein N-acetyltransferase